MKKTFLTALCALFALQGMSQERFTGKYHCEQLKATLQLNLVDNNIEVKELDVDDAYGVMRGNLNGVWVVLKVKKADAGKALVRMVSDSGIDAQDVELRLTEGGDVELRLVGEENMKAIETRKYVKMPKVSVFKKTT